MASFSQEEEGDNEEEKTGEKLEPTHHSDLDPKTMKVSELRKELECRTLSSKGLKSQLIARLTKAMKGELEKEEQDKDNKEEEKEVVPEEGAPKTEVDEKEEEKKKKEEEEKKRRDERDKVARERRYHLPENPSILVHPSATAKSGKFDCTVMSLSVLLDYRPEDNKEHSFEVSLFAELFNEMLMRDSGFRIYKSLLAAPEKKEEEKKEKEKSRDRSGSKEPSHKRRKTEEDNSKDEKKDDKKGKKEEEKKGDKNDEEEMEHDGDEEEEEEAEEEEASEEGEEKKKDTKDSKEKKPKKEEKKKEKVKYHTSLPDLLLAFVYFDQSHTGYLLDKDVEEILHTLGLQLSRAQIRKLVQKLVTRDTLNYRKITDNPRTEKKEVEAAEGGEGTGDGANAVEKLAQGNWPLMVDVKPETSVKQEQSKSVSKEGQEASGMVMYEGSLLDIANVLQRLEKSEKDRQAVETKLKTVAQEMDNLKTNFDSSEQNGQKVSQELQELKKSLREQRKCTEEAESSSKKYHGALTKSRSSLTSLLADMSKTMDSVKVEVKTEPKENGES